MQRNWVCAIYGKCVYESLPDAPRRVAHHQRRLAVRAHLGVIIRCPSLTKRDRIRHTCSVRRSLGERERPGVHLKKELNPEIWGKGVCDIWEKWVSGWRNKIHHSRGYAAAPASPSPRPPRSPRSTRRRARRLPSGRAAAEADATPARVALR